MIQHTSPELSGRVVYPTSRRVGFLIQPHDVQVLLEVHFVETAPKELIVAL